MLFVWLRTARERVLTKQNGYATCVSTRKPPRQWAQEEGAEPSSPSADGEITLGVSLLVTFLFAPAVSKRKVAKDVETQSVCRFRAIHDRPCESNFVRSFIKIENRYFRFFFCPCRPKRKSLAKRKRPGGRFALCGARPRLRALDGRPLAWGLFPQAKCST